MSLARQSCFGLCGSCLEVVQEFLNMSLSRVVYISNGHCARDDKGQNFGGWMRVNSNIRRFTFLVYSISLVGSHSCSALLYTSIQVNLN